MQVRMKTMMAGPDGCAASGQIITLSAEEAAQLIAGNYAETVDEADAKALPKAAAVEEAIAEAKERAVGPGANRTGKNRKRGRP